MRDEQGVGRGVDTPDGRDGEEISYGFLEGARYAIEHRGRGLPGVNDWDRRPDPRHPAPVVLLHGTAGSAVTEWFSLAPSLTAAGHHVFAPTYGVVPGARWPETELGGLRDLARYSVPEVAAFVDRVLAATGAEQVDLVGHSQGGVIAGDLAKRIRPGRVRRVVTLAAPWSGVGHGGIARLLRAADVPELGGHALAMADDLMTGSDYLTGLAGEEGTPYARGVGYTNIATRYDTVVVPHTSALPVPPEYGGYRVTNLVLQDGCMIDLVDHAALPADPRAIDLVHNALDPDHPRPVRCVPTAPLLGAVLPGLPVRTRGDRPVRGAGLGRGRAHDAYRVLAQLHGRET